MKDKSTDDNRGVSENCVGQAVLPYHIQHQSVLLYTQEVASSILNHAFNHHVQVHHALLLPIRLLTGRVFQSY